MRYSAVLQLPDASGIAETMLLLINSPMSSDRVRERSMRTIDAFVREQSDVARISIKAALRREREAQLKKAKICLLVGKECEQLMRRPDVKESTLQASVAKRRQLANVALRHEHVADLLQQYIDIEFEKQGGKK